MGGGCCLGPEGNGVSFGKGVREGLAPQEAREISRQCEARDNLDKDEEERQIEEGSARTEQAIFSSQKMGDHVINVNYAYH
jgi:hypothetical protein